MKPGTTVLLGFGLGAVALGGAALALAAATPAPAPPPPKWLMPAVPATRRQEKPMSVPPEQRWPPERKLWAADPRLQLDTLLARLEARGHQPRLVFTWRSLATQDGLLAAGRSRLSFSLHNAVGEGAQPQSLAADLIDARYGWGDSKHGSDKANGALAFFRDLGELAGELGLEWGGTWTRRPSFWSRYGIGWDPAHIQVPGVVRADVRDRSLDELTMAGVLGGSPRVVHGTGDYVYRQWPNGYIQVGEESPALRGVLLMPKGSARAWDAITAEIGPHPLAPTTRRA